MIAPALTAPVKLCVCMAHVTNTEDTVEEHDVALNAIAESDIHNDPRTLLPICRPREEATLMPISEPTTVTLLVPVIATLVDTTELGDGWLSVNAPAIEVETKITVAAIACVDPNEVPVRQ